MSKQIIPSYWKQCCTCSNWGGSRRPLDPQLNNVEVDTSEKGKCFGGGYNQCDMPAGGTCSSWRQQYQK